MVKIFRAWSSVLRERERRPTTLHLSHMALFFRSPKPQKPAFLHENQQIEFTECGGEGDLRTLNNSSSYRISLSVRPVTAFGRKQTLTAIPTPCPQSRTRTGHFIVGQGVDKQTSRIDHMPTPNNSRGSSIPAMIARFHNPVDTRFGWGWLIALRICWASGWCM